MLAQAARESAVLFQAWSGPKLGGRSRACIVGATSDYVAGARCRPSCLIMKSSKRRAGARTNRSGDRLHKQWLTGSAWLGGGTLASLGVTVIAGIALARFLGPRGLGAYAAVTVATSLITVLSIYGLDLHLVTILGLDGNDVGSYDAVARLAFVLCFTASLIGEGVAWLAFSGQSRLALMIDLGEVAFAPLLLRAVVLQVRGKQRSVVTALLLNRVTWIVVVVAVVLAHPRYPLPWLLGGRVLALWVQGSILRLLAKLPASPRVNYRVAAAGSLKALRASSPIALGSLLGNGYNRVDQLLLSGMRGPYMTGLYAAGVRLAELPGSIPGIVQNVSLPTLVRLHHEGRRQDLCRALDGALLLTIVPGGLAVALLAGLGRPLVVLVLGQGFSGAAAAVVILAAADWARLPGTVYTSLALAVGRRRALVIGTGCGFAVNLVVNFALIPLLGAIGAALASLLGYGTSAVVVARAIRGELRGTRGRRLLTVRLGIAAALPALLGHFVQLSLAGDALLIILGYVFIIGVLLPDERRRLLLAGGAPLRGARSVVRWRR